MKTPEPNPCKRCPGHCCFRNLINVCGYDAWCIAGALKIGPTDFLGFALLEEESTPYNFKLDGSGKSYYMVLNMKEHKDGTRRCVFGLDLPRNQFRCGIYALRPIPCRAYPFILEGGEPRIKEWCLCPDESWDPDHLDTGSLKEDLGRFQMEFCIYGLLVSAWNKRVRNAPRQKKMDFRPFVSFVMETYDSLQQARTQIPEADWPGIWHRWRTSMAEGTNPLWPAGDSAGTSSWEWWLRHVHNIVG